jgi:hypothetical protein
LNRDLGASSAAGLEVMTEPEFEIHLDYTEAEYAEYEALQTRQQRALAKVSFWSGSTAQVGFGVAVAGLVSLLAVSSGASSSQAGGIIAALAFAAFYTGLWTPYITRWFSRASRFALFKTYIGSCRLSVTDTGIWVSTDTGTRSFMPYSCFRSATVRNTLLVFTTETQRSLLALPVRLLTPEWQVRLIELVRANTPQVP